MPKKLNRYQALIQKIFFDHYTDSATDFEFVREELDKGAAELGFAQVKNLGDVPYSFRYRNDLPDSILETQSEGLEWIIEGAGKGRYRFKLVKENRIVPRENQAAIDIPDATPELIRAYALDDEQALLAIVRYNRLIDTFLGLTTYSLQNHLRTTVKGMGQIEIDELYIGLDKHGCHYVIPVQAKGGKDRIGIVQTAQDIRFVEQRFPDDDDAGRLRLNSWKIGLSRFSNSRYGTNQSRRRAALPSRSGRQTRRQRYPGLPQLIGGTTSAPGRARLEAML